MASRAGMLGRRANATNFSSDVRLMCLTDCHMEYSCEATTGSLRRSKRNRVRRGSGAFEAAERVRVLKSRVVVEYDLIFAVPQHVRCPTVTCVKVGVGEELPFRVPFDIDAEAIDRVADEA